MTIRLACIGIVVAMCGCTGNLLHSNAPVAQVYVLRAAAAAQTQSAPNTATLRIGRTSAAPGLDSDRIVLVQADRRMDYYAASRWAAPVPQLIEALAVDTMRSSGAWSAVNDSQGVFPADYFLQIAIRRFDADYTEGGDPKIHVILDCSLGRSRGNGLLTSFVAEGSAAATANRLGAVVAAFEQAANAALATVAQRAGDAIAAAASKPAAG